MDDADLDGTGRVRTARVLAESDPQGQHRAVGAIAAAAARTRQFFHNTLVTQVSLRSLAFVDRYR